MAMFGHFTMLAVLFVLFPSIVRMAVVKREAMLPKKTEFMTSSELALHGNLSAGDIIESKIVINLPNGTKLELPLYHKAIVVDPVELQIVHYRYKDDNDTTEEERRRIAALGDNTKEGAGPEGVIRGLFQSMIDQVMHDVKGVQSENDLDRIHIDCKGPVRDGLLNMMYKYDPKHRKVYQDNLVESIREPVRVNNELDNKWSPMASAQIILRAMSRIGEEKFDLRNHNCETFANWARYGVNYTEQGERVGAVLNNAIGSFNQLCEQANRNLRSFLASAASDIRTKKKNGAIGGGGAGWIAGAAACVLFPPGCPIALSAGVGGGIIAGYHISYAAAVAKAARDGERELRDRLRHYMPEAARILKRIVQELKLDEIIQMDV